MVKLWSSCWQFSSPTVKGSRHVYLRDRTGGNKYHRLNARINQAIDHGFNWNDGDVLYSELESVLHREASSPVAIYCFGPQKTQFISGVMYRTVIDITQPGCPPLADISLQGISCTFARHNEFRHVCGQPIH